jgi:polyisoprenyl-phosphate glycosyltransferase
LAADTFLSSSAVPIKLIVSLGFLSSSLALVGHGVLHLRRHCLAIGGCGSDKFPRGWISLVLLISFFSGLILLSLGVLAEYVWRIYEEVKGRPGYIIRRKP